MRKTDALVELLRDYHPYYADHPKNKLFIVLTQSCDLVRRAGACKSRYVTLAPVRPLSNIIEYEFSERLNYVDEQAYASKFVLSDVQRFLSRLFNNNEPSYFYLERDNGVGIYDSMCAMLALPISFKSSHYDAFVGARIVAVEDAFQAKLGWLLGQQFSRVGTRDWASEIDGKVEAVTEEIAVWVEDASIDPLKRLIRQHQEGNPGGRFDQKSLNDLLLTVPKKKNQIIDAVIEEAARLGLVEDPKGPNRRKFRLGLTNNSALASLLR